MGTIVLCLLSPASAAATTPQSLLRPGESVSVKIRPGELYICRFPTEAGGLIDGDLELQGAGVSVRLYRPDGALLLALESPGTGVSPGPLLAVSSAPGDFRLELRDKGRVAGSVRLRLRPARIPSAADQERAAAAVHLSRANASHAGGDDRAAAAESIHALRLWHPEDRKARAITLYGLALSQEVLRDFSASLESSRSALQEFARSHDRAGVAIATEGVARALFLLQRAEESMSWHRNALRLFRALGDRAGEAEVLGNLGLLYYKSMGSAKEALLFDETALAIFEDLGETGQQAVLLNNLGQISLDIGRPDDAIAWLEQSLRITSSSANVVNAQLLALSSLGQAHYYRGETRLALDFLRRARESGRQDPGADFGRAVALRQLASILLGTGETEPRNLDLARHAAERSRKIAQRIKDPASEAFANALLGWILELQKQSGKALEVLGAARKLFQDRQDKGSEASVLFGIAHAERSLGHLMQAREAMERSLALVENVRTVTSSLEMRSAFWARLRPRYEFLIDLLMELDRLQPGKGYDARAFEVSEEARARVVLDELAESGTKLGAGADPQLVERDRALRREIERAQQERSKLAQDADSQPRRERLDQKLAELMARHEVVVAGLRAGNGARAADLRARPRSLPEIQREVLDGDSILLAYWLGKKESILWRIDHGSLETYRLPGRDQIESLAIELRDHFAMGNLAVSEPKAARVAARLSDLLLGPIANRLSAVHLLVLPDGALRYVPFASLAVSRGTSSDGWADRPLIVDHDIVRLPSASVLALLRKVRRGRRPAPHAVAVVAHPVFQDTDPRLPGPGRVSAQAATPRSAPSAKLGKLPDLPFSESEARGVLSLAPAGEGFSALAFDASLKTAMSPKLGLYRMVHFATHSLIDERPDLSGLVLSRFDEKGRPRDGFLTVLDLYELHLPVEMVVLSACRTDQGEDPAGEGLGRLTRGFLYAGARRVVVTQWSIRDRATAELMIHFYRSLLKDGLSPSAALRQAQLFLRADPRWRPPYYWAGFVLEGEP